MSFYPPQGSHHSARVYPATPIPGAGFPTPQLGGLQVPGQPPMMIVPSRVSSRHSRHSHHSHRSRHDDDSDYDRHHDRDRDYHHDRDYQYDRGRDYPHDRDRDRHRSHSRHRSHHSDRDRRHRDRDDRKRHRGHRRHHTAPQVMIPPQMGAPYPGQFGVAPSAGYPGSTGYYDYRPSFGQRLRQFFGFAPASPHYQYKSNQHSWGFLGRSKRPRYIDARTGLEVDKYGRTVHRI